MFFLFITCLFGRLSACEEHLNFLPSAKKEIRFLNLSMAAKRRATASEKKLFSEKYQFHIVNAERTYNDAKDRSWWLPDIDDRQIARTCFNTIGALALPGTPQSRIVAGLISLMINYGLDCISEWEYINNKLYWSQYHYEMAEFYANAIKG